MPRKSLQAMATAPIIDASKARQRPPPVEGLDDGEKAIWRRVAAAMPASWFKREHLDLLARYCQHQARAAKFNRMASAFGPADIGERISLEDLDRVSRMADRESRAALALARSMRITHQAQLKAETAHNRRANKPHEGPFPWDIPAAFDGLEGDE